MCWVLFWRKKTVPYGQIRLKSDSVYITSPDLCEVVQISGQLEKAMNSSALVLNSKGCSAFLTGCVSSCSNIPVMLCVHRLLTYMLGARVLSSWEFRSLHRCTSVWSGSFLLSGAEKCPAQAWGRAETAPSFFWFCGRMMAVSRRGEEQNQTWQNPNLAFWSVAIVNRGEAVWV